MNLNYTAFFLIAFVPLITAVIWYHPKSFLYRTPSDKSSSNFLKVKPLTILIALALSLAFVYGCINLTIHQLGFYELFFTDIMLGNEEAKSITEEFLAKYGDKHRHLGHGLLHGAINAFLFALPFTCFYAFMENKTTVWLVWHFSYWLVTSMLVCGLISVFV